MKRFLLLAALIATHTFAYILGDYFGFRDTVGADRGYGRFLSRPKTEWLEDRKMRLLEDFVYVDPKDNAWLAPKGSEVDGASIPQVFWSWIGSPLTGKYRDASIVHDVACIRRDKPYRDVHRMFFDACLAGGVPENDAKRLYYAVARYGPKWNFEVRNQVVYGAGPDNNPTQPKTVQYTVSVPVRVEQPSNAEIEWAATYFAEHDLEIDKIQELAAVSEENQSQPVSIPID